MTDRKSGAKKKRALRFWLIGGIAVLLALGVSAVLVGYAWRYARQAGRFREAVAAYRQGDWEAAEPLLRRSIREDRNHEAAWIMLAEVLEQQKRYRRAAAAWQVVCSLNRLDSKWFARKVHALLLAREYESLIRKLEALDATSRQPFAVPLALACQMTGKVEKRNAALAMIPASAHDDRTQFVRFLARHDASASGAASPAAELRRFAGSADAVTAQEGLLQLLAPAIREERWPEAEERLRELLDLNPEVGWPLFGDFLYARKRYGEAAVAYQHALRYFLPFHAAIRYADSLYYTGNLEALKKLFPLFERGSREQMMVGFYLEALIGYMSNDSELLGRGLKRLDGSVLSPLVPLLWFDYALRRADLPLLLANLKTIAADAELKSFYPQAVAALQPLLTQFYQRQQTAQVNDLARWLALHHPDNRLAVRIVLLNLHAEKRLDAATLEAALKRFPDDPVLLVLTADMRQQQRDYAGALAAARHHIAIQPESVFAQLQEAEALTLAGQSAAAAEKYDALRKKYPDDLAVLKAQLLFGIRTGRPLPAGADAPDNRGLASLCAGEMAFREKDAAAMVRHFSDPALLEALNTRQPVDQELRYYLARRLAEADAIRPAIAIYEQLKPLAVDPTLIRLNLSELYALSGESGRAEAEAREAWLARRDNPAVQTCYGLRLREAGKLTEAFQLLDVALERNPGDPRVAPAWRGVLEALIEQSFAARNDAASMNYCRQLLSRYPDNRIALDFQARIRQRQQP